MKPKQSKHLTGTLITVGTSESIHPEELGRPRIVIYTTEDAVRAVKTIPFGKPVVVISAQSLGRIKRRKKNARFWTYWRGSWVKLTLKDGGPTVTMRFSCKDDEGHCFEEEHYWLERGIVHNHSISGGRDCDGPIEHGQRYYCNLRDLKAKPAEDDLRYSDGRVCRSGSPARPAWSKEGHGRDSWRSAQQLSRANPNY